VSRNRGVAGRLVSGAEPAPHWLPFTHNYYYPAAKGWARQSAGKSVNNMIAKYTFFTYFHFFVLFFR
jgi:hypothetical protein